jgi:YesN/AraC family two-component response regulator
MSTIVRRRNRFPGMVRRIGRPILRHSLSHQNELLAWPSVHCPKAWSPNIFDLKRIIQEAISLRAGNGKDGEPQKLMIKNMVSLRCKLVVEMILNDLRLKFGTVQLGEVEMMERLSPQQHVALKAALATVGLELMDDRKAVIVEKVRNVIVEMIHYSDRLPITNFSDYISNKLGQNYTYLSNVFSEVKGLSIQQFIINQRIERVKELALYGELSFSEIAWKLQYSSVAHLSNQFKKVTGMKFSDFKKLKLQRAHLEDL